MFNLIPNDLAEVAQKLAFLHENGQPETTEQDILLATAKDGAQDLINEALEGPYYDVHWQTKDQVLLVAGPLKAQIGTLTPRPDFETFSADFKNNSILFWRNLAKQISVMLRQE